MFKQNNMKQVIFLLLASVFVTPLNAIAQTSPAKTPDAIKLPANSNAVAVIAEELVKTPPVLPYNYSEKQYEDYFKNNHVNFTKIADLKKPTTLPSKPVVKPIDVEFSNFWEGSATQSLKVYANTETNLGRGGYAIVKIDSVLNSKGENVYDKDNSSETMVLFHKIFNDTITKDEMSINADRQVHLKKDTKEADIKSISGSIHLYLPVNPKIINISSADVGKTKEISTDLKIKVEKFGTTEQTVYKTSGSVSTQEKEKIGEVSVYALGKNSNLLLGNFYPYNSKDSLLAKNGWGSSGSDDNKLLSWTIKGMPTSIQLIVAEKFFEKEYPFTLTK